jgi:hypothetical protein
MEHHAKDERRGGHYDDYEIKIPKLVFFGVFLEPPSLFHTLSDINDTGRRWNVRTGRPNGVSTPSLPPGDLKTSNLWVSPLLYSHCQHLQGGILIPHIYLPGTLRRHCTSGVWSEQKRSRMAPYAPLPTSRCTCSVL